MDSKVCQYCGSIFPRPSYHSARQWASQKFCSRTCAAFALRKRKAVICKACGKQLEVHRKSSQKFCSRECANYAKQFPSPENLRKSTQRLLDPENRRKASEGRRRYHAAHSTKKRFVCEYCGISFSDFRCLSRRFCSRHCKDHWWAEHRLEIVICPGCGEPFQRSTTRGRLKTFCGHLCYLQHLKTLRGPKNRNWKGGPSCYGPDWDKIADSIRERDKVCQGCGKTPQENGYPLDVHHIIAFREFNDDFAKAHEPSNLKALCKHCHRKYQQRDY